MRQMLIEQRGLARKLAELEKELTGRLDIHETAINEILKHGDQVKVIRPKSLRELIKTEAEKISKIYYPKGQSK
jgi:predicted DNA-binding transcriptional regulator YafY